jgi:nitrite reductase/ring-hydroxylating ferredoxin subunit/thioredoxin reductase
MPEVRVLDIAELPLGTKRLVKVGNLEILLIHYEDGIAAVQSKCPHAGGPLHEGAVCNGRLVCPWHMGTFVLPEGRLLEPPPMEALKSYRVRVKGKSIFLDTNPKSAAPDCSGQIEAESIFLIVGAGAAGSMAATTLRQNCFAGRLVMVDPRPEEPIDRTQLSKDALTGKVPLTDIKLPTSPIVREDRRCATLKSLSAARREAKLSDGSTIRFDRALVATGGKPKRLDIPGAELAYTIRESTDVKRILDATESIKEVVILGGSFIALEAASALVQKGLHVTVAAKETLPFEKQFGTEPAMALKKLHESKGTEFRLGCEFVKITTEGVEIRDGDRSVSTSLRQVA